MMMAMRHFVAAALAFGVSAFGPALAVAQHSAHSAPPVEARLTNDQKWETDATLRAGMGEMRRMVGHALAASEAGRFTSADYAMLADQLQSEVDVVVANCKLPADADAALHIVLADIIEGIDTMKTGENRVVGTMRVLHALEDYGLNFDHPGWATAAR